MKIVTKEPWQMTESEYNSYIESLQNRVRNGQTNCGATISKDSFKAYNELVRINGGYSYQKQIEMHN